MCDVFRETNLLKVAHVANGKLKTAVLALDSFSVDRLPPNTERWGKILPEICVEFLAPKGLPRLPAIEQSGHANLVDSRALTSEAVLVVHGLTRGANLGLPLWKKLL
jgi:hypothetical protein